MLTRAAKLKLYHIDSTRVNFYAKECTQSEEQMLDTFERKIIRGIYGHANIDGEWRSCFSHEHYSMFNEARLSRKVRTKKLRCRSILLSGNKVYQF